jgi:CRP-like cAMP-binding protein
MGMDTEMALEDSPLTDGMTALEMEYLMQRMTASLYTAGDLIFREGDSDSGMLLVLRGSVTIGQEAGSNGKVKRVFTYGPGSVIGELAMLDQQKRSASAWADGVVAVLGLSADEFKVIKEHRPQLAVKLLSNLARVVSNKLRRASNELAALEDG